MKPSPIFEGADEQKIADQLKEEYIRLLSHQGKEMLNLPFFAPKFKGIANWLCSLSSEKKGLIIGGSVGIGKTTLLKAIKMVLVRNNKLFLSNVSASLVNDSYKVRDSSEAWDALLGKAILRLPKGDKPVCEILLIDDLGMEEDMVNDYGTKSQPMAKLLHERADKGLITIVTTNFPSIESMRAKYDDRVIDRLSSYAKLFYNIKSFRV